MDESSCLPTLPLWKFVQVIFSIEIASRESDFSDFHPKQVEEASQQQCYGAERGVWTENMLIALERGIKGNKWFSLIDKVVSERTLGIAWTKVQSNAGACGVDGITVRHFSKDSQSRLLAVNEHLREGRYQPKPIRRVYIPKPGSSEKRPLGIPTVCS